MPCRPESRKGMILPQLTTPANYTHARKKILAEKKISTEFLLTFLYNPVKLVLKIHKNHNFGLKVHSLSNTSELEIIFQKNLFSFRAEHKFSEVSKLPTIFQKNLFSFRNVHNLSGTIQKKNLFSFRTAHNFSEKSMLFPNCPQFFRKIYFVSTIFRTRYKRKISNILHITVQRVTWVWSKWTKFFRGKQRHSTTNHLLNYVQLVNS